MNLFEISQNTLERYNQRYNTTKRDVKTLGWGTIEQQDYRFAQAIENLSLSGKSILDVGCGFGDLKIFLDKNQVLYKNYVGWDLNKNFIQEAQESPLTKDAEFRLEDISRFECSATSQQFDIVVMLGLLNFNLKSPETNYNFSRQLIQKAFSLCKEVLVVDFLSSELTDAYPKEDFVFYHNPLNIAELALNLSSDFILKHNYKAIPQKEFMLYIYK